MKTIEKWWPHLYPKVKRIASVTFEDGATIEVRGDDELRAYLRSRGDEAAKAEARRLGIPPPADIRAVLRAKASMDASERASKPRKYPGLTAEAIESFIDQWMAEKRRTSRRGAITAAAAHFGCPEDAVRHRLRKRNSG